MAKQSARSGLIFAAGVSAVAMAACSRSVPEEYGPPPPSVAAERPAPPELAGGPPATAPAPTAVDAASLPPVGATQRAAPAANSGPPPRMIVSMAPIPNPAGPPARAPVAAPPPRPVVAHAPVHAARPHFAKSGHVPVARPVEVIAMRPIPNPQGSPRSERHRPHAPPRPYVAHSAPPRLAQAPSIRSAPGTITPVIKAPAPIVVKPPVVKPPVVVAAKPATPLEALQTAVGGVVSGGASLTVAPEIAQGKPGSVSLSLPATLFDTIKSEAAKVGLAKAARKSEVSATLSGEGYSVAPSGQQTAALKKGEAARFSWQVQPMPSAKGPLKAQIDAKLNGQGHPKSLPLATLQSTVAVAASQFQTKGFQFKLPYLPSFAPSKAAPSAAASAPEQAGPPPAPSAKPEAAMHDRTLPGVSRISGRTQAAIGLAVLAVIILALAGRNLSAQKRLADRRRRYRTYQPMAMDETPAGA